MTRINKIVPRSPREVEQFYRDILPKVEGTDTTLQDEEQKSNLPIIGMIQAVDRRIESLYRDTRFTRLMIETVARLEKENRTLAVELSQLKRRVQNIEGEL